MQGNHVHIVVVQQSHSTVSLCSSVQGRGQRNPDPLSCSHYLRRHVEYILTLTSLSSLVPRPLLGYEATLSLSHSHLSLSLTKYTYFLGFTISYVAMVIQTEAGRGVCVCVCVRERERERE